MKRLLALCMLCALFLCACLPLNAAPDASPAPTPSPTPFLTPAPTESVYSINPVSAFYAEFDRDVSRTLATLGAALGAENAIDAMENRMRLDAHMNRLKQASASVGRLTASGNYYADTLIGAASGAGTLSPAVNSDGVYAFTFLYTQSKLLTGTLQSDALLFSMHTAVVEEVTTESLDAETGEMLPVVTEQTRPEEELFRAALYKTPSDWVSVVVQGEESSILRFRAGRAYYLSAVLPADVSPRLPYASLLPYAQHFCTFENGALTYSGQNHS